MSEFLNSVNLLAASGMGAGIAQQINGQYSLLCALISLVVTLAVLIDYYRHKDSAWIVMAIVVLTLTHPIVSVNPIGGDMGCLQRDLSFVSTGIVVVLFFVMYFRRSVGDDRNRETWSDIDRTQATNRQ